MNWIIRGFSGLARVGALGSAFCRGAIIDLLEYDTRWSILPGYHSFFDVLYEIVFLNRCWLRGNFAWMGKVGWFL